MPNSTNPERDVRPLSPVSDTVDGSSTSAPSMVEPVPVDPPQLDPPQERKLTIRVPVEYIPPTPPPSASLPAIPPGGTPMSATQKKRASAPASSWSASRVLGSDDTSMRADAPGPVMPPVQEAVTPPGPVNVTVTDSERAPPKTILVAGSKSAIHLPTTAKKAQLVTQEKQGPRYSTDLLPPPEPAHPRRLSAPTRPQQQLQQQQTLQPPARRVRKSPSLNNSPSHVSLIDFESSSEEEDGDDDAQSQSSPQNLVQTRSIPEEAESPTPTPTPRARTQRQAATSDTSDVELSCWAPEPAHFPTQSISISYAVNAPPPPRARSHSSNAPSVRSDASAVGSASTGRRRGGKHLAMLGLPPMPTDAVQRNVDYTTRALMSPAMFARMLADPLARQRFREFLAVDGSTAELDCWTDAQFLAQTVDQLQGDAAAFRDLYLAPAGSAHVELAPETRRELLGMLQRVLGVDASLGSTQHRLLESLYNDQFQRFVKHKLIQEAHVTLGTANLAAAEGREGLGDAFVLTNPRLPDHPIVLVSDGFVDVTGYPKAQIIGRNCRFLQGPGTPPESVQRIRDGLNSGKGCTELLLNYRRNGDPFYCLLCIIPVRDASGAIVYFIGGQTNVTGLLATERGLGLHGTGDVQPMQMSPALAALREQAAAGVLSPAMADPVRAAGSVASSGRGAPGGGSGFFRGLFGRGAPAGAGSVRPDGKQVIAGAEAVMSGPGPRGLQEQYALFQHTYNKILIFKFKKREITFVSPQMLIYLGLPTRTQRELHASPLIRHDIATLLTAGEDKNETRRLRDELKDAIRRGMPCSLYCGVKIPGKNILTRSDNARHKFGMMHMTPIKDADNVAVAFVAIFG